MPTIDKLPELLAKLPERFQWKQQIDTIMQMPFPENWYDLQEHFAGHRII